MRVVGSEKTVPGKTTYFGKPAPKNANGKNVTPPFAAFTWNNRPVTWNSRAVVL